jgi:two-component system NtrC family sensor kinase
MQGILEDEFGFSFFESMIDGQNRHHAPDTLQIDALNRIGEYLQAQEVVLALFDDENRDLVAKKHLGTDHSWRAESTFLLQSSHLCRSALETITPYDLNFRLGDKTDPLLADLSANSIKNMVMAPLCAGDTTLGAILFINPLLGLTDPGRNRFFRLMIKTLANAMVSMTHQNKLNISKAKLEASQWEIVNSRNTLRTFFDNIPTCVYIVDRSYTIVAINSLRSNRVRKSPQELVGGKCYEKLFGNSAPCPLCHVPETFNGIPSVRSLREWGPNETFTHWEITTIPIREGLDQVNRVIVFDEDITEKWILEQNLIESEKLASIGQLAANVAHEINNPLAAIIANAQLMLQITPETDEDMFESLKLIETAGQRAAKIVGNLLESARREKREEFEEVFINETIQDALSMVNYEVKKRSINVKLSLPKDLPPLYAHKIQLKGVWINLIMNAIGVSAGYRKTELVNSSPSPMWWISSKELLSSLKK